MPDGLVREAIYKANEPGERRAVVNNTSAVIRRPILYCKRVRTAVKTGVRLTVENMLIFRCKSRTSAYHSALYVVPSPEGSFVHMRLP